MRLSNPSSSAEEAGMRTSEQAQGHLHYYLCLEHISTCLAHGFAAPPRMCGRDLGSWAVWNVFDTPHQDQQCIFSVQAMQALHW